MSPYPCQRKRPPIRRGVGLLVGIEEELRRLFAWCDFLAERDGAFVLFEPLITSLRTRISEIDDESPAVLARRLDELHGRRETGRDFLDADRDRGSDRAGSQTAG